MSPTEWVVLGLAAGIAFIYFGYPLSIVALGAVRRYQTHKQPIFPSVTLIIAAYNEESEIEGRIRNALDSEYPSEKLAVIVASDGSNDATEAIVSLLKSSQVRLLSLPRQGKIAALNAAASQAQGEILLFTDANTRHDPGAIRDLVRNFADPEVGAVSAATAYQKIAGSRDAAAVNESLYWKYELWMKQMEGRTGSIVSAAGGFYAVRRHLYRHLDPSAMPDDFMISTSVVEAGYRLVFEPQARAVEPPASDAGQEYGRKVRIMTQGFRALFLRRRLLNPFKFGVYAYVLFCHKLLRRLVGVFLVLIFGVTLAGAGESPALLALLLGQVVFYWLALTGWALHRAHMSAPACFGLPYYYCMVNAAAVVALFRALRGRRVTQWETVRKAATHP